MTIGQDGDRFGSPFARVKEACSTPQSAGQRMAQGTELMKKVAFALLGILLLLVAYLSLWPVPVEPVAWTAPAASGYTAAHAPNDRLAGLQLIALGDEAGPEHVVLARDGKLYAAMASQRSHSAHEPRRQRTGSFRYHRWACAGLRLRRRRPDDRCRRSEWAAGHRPGPGRSVAASRHRGHPPHSSLQGCAIRRPIAAVGSQARWACIHGLERNVCATAAHLAHVSRGVVERQCSASVQSCGRHIRNECDR